MMQIRFLIIQNKKYRISINIIKYRKKNNHKKIFNNKIKLRMGKELKKKLKMMKNNTNNNNLKINKNKLTMMIKMNYYNN